MPRVRLFAAAAIVVGMLTISLTASATHNNLAVKTFQYSKNMRPLGFSPNPVPLF
jgi:hypothetical protein